MKVYLAYGSGDWEVPDQGAIGGEGLHAVLEHGVEHGMLTALTRERGRSGEHMGVRACFYSRATPV